MQKWGHLAQHAVGMETQKSIELGKETQKWYLVGIFLLYRAEATQLGDVTS